MALVARLFARREVERPGHRLGWRPDFDQIGIPNRRIIRAQAAAIRNAAGTLGITVLRAGRFAVLKR